MPAEAQRGPDRWFSLFYSFVSPVYDRLWIRKEMRRDLVSRLRLQPGHLALETGVGTGANLPLICEALGPCGRVEGIDLSSGMLRRARGKTASLPCPVHLHLHNACDLPYPDNHFDAVLHFGGINFFTERERALREMVRVTKVGGRLVIADETAAFGGRLGGALSALALRLLPRLRPPLDLIPPQAEIAGMEHSARGFFYILELVKTG